MSEMKSEPETTTKPAGAPIFVAKQEGTVEISLDDALTQIKVLKAKAAELEKVEKNLIQVAKDMMKARNLEAYTSPVGIKAQWYTSQKPEINKELAKELLGPNWSKVESFKVVKSFKVQ